MKILFITLFDFRDVDAHDIYSDLMREFAKNGHEVFIASPYEKRHKKKTALIEYPGCGDWHKNVHILKQRIGNIQKTNVIEKGISTILLEGQFKRGIKKYFGDVRFDSVLCSTPPITLIKPIKYVKKKCGAKVYLMLKDIFPQNAVDLGMLSKTGTKSVIYKFFRKKEKGFYALADRIGCMSKANVDYVLANNPEIDSEKVEILPNAIDVLNVLLSDDERREMRVKYDIPLDKKVFVYGGNLGAPQGIPFIVECLKTVAEDKEAFFLIVGDGTEYSRLEEYAKESGQSNLRLMKRLPKDDYDKMIASCDVGLIFLDNRFTIPNYPSRLLSYMQAGLPVLACTDSVSDIGGTITSGGFGVWISSADPSAFPEAVKKSVELLGTDYKAKELKYLEDNFSVRVAVNIIMSYMEKANGN